ncbi:MAG: Stp1/IreP family PP2C-type Ser/Thr phosphatase [candidate division Zixibacteria bacterium]|nr:Stp1/IreP family PP2C-type Ser/Thr phosphatase [candidate division Zixibacteria bacterium]
MKIAFAGATDVGRVRHHNEDNFAIDEPRRLMIVCDGMGGHAAGEVASQIGIESITGLFAKPGPGPFGQESFRYPEPITAEGKLLVGAIAVANHRIIHHSRAVPGQTGMGTTVVACHFAEGIVTVCHVGDSRAYLVRDGIARRVTIDHSWVSEMMEKHNLSEEEAEAQVNKNVITRALGTKPAIRVDISQLRLCNNDIFVICSDGLTGMVSDSEIMRAVEANAANLGTLVQTLIDQANAAGGADNVTVCAARVLETKEAADFDEVRRVTVDWSEEPEMSALAAVCAESFSEAPNPAANASAAFEETQGIKTPGAKKKRLISPLAIIIFIIVLIIILAIWYS